VCWYGSSRHCNCFLEWNDNDNDIPKGTRNMIRSMESKRWCLWSMLSVDWIDNDLGRRRCLSPIVRFSFRCVLWCCHDVMTCNLSTQNLQTRYRIPPGQLAMLRNHRQGEDLDRSYHYQGSVAAPVAAPPVSEISLPMDRNSWYIGRLGILESDDSSMSILARFVWVVILTPMAICTLAWINRLRRCLSH
jgi:hypothetical protein